MSTAYEDPVGDYRDSRWKVCSRNLSLVKNISLDSLEPLVPALAGKRVRLFGDSVMDQLLRAMQEMLRNVDFHPEHTFMPMIPHRREDLIADLDTHGEITVFIVGLWYNWKKEEANLNRTRISPDYTASFLATHCPQPLPFFPDERRAYASLRRRCGANGLDAYASDLHRLAGVVRQLKRKDPQRRFIVKSLPPQFFIGGAGNWQGHPTKCIPVPPEMRSVSDLRNSIARAILGPSGDFEFVDTFEEELAFWGLHPEGDCTHFCNPSAGTWLAVRELSKRIAAR